MAQDHGVLAIDVGSSCVKLGWFPAAGDCAAKPAAGDLAIARPTLAFPDEVLRLEHSRHNAGEWLASLDAWLDALPPPADIQCVLGVVHQRAAATLLERLEKRPWARLHRVSRRDVNLEVHVREPDRVGIDRLSGALAANQLRRPHAPAVVVDMGTALTVNVLSSDGAFAGGAIMPGPTTSLAALHAATTTLPPLETNIFTKFPTAVGKSTAEAIAAGVYWGAIGAIEKLVAMMTVGESSPPAVFLTGGASAAFAPALAGDGLTARHVPHLVLAGIRLAADRLTTL